MTYIVFSKHLPISSNEIRTGLNLSKQLLNYHIKKLTAKGLIWIEIRDAQNFYGPTRKGKLFFVNEPSVGMKAPILGLHNIAFKFRILKGKNFRLKKTTTLRGWTKHHCFFDGSYVEKTTKNLIICPIKKGERLEGTDPFKLKQEARDRAMKIAQHFIDRNDLVLEKPKICRKPHFGVQDPVARTLPIEVSTKQAKIDDSEGTGGEIDFLTPQAASNYLSMPGKVDKIEDRLEKIMNVMEQQASQMEIYGKHLNAHIPVLKGMDKLIKKLCKKLDQKNIKEFL